MNIVKLQNELKNVPDQALIGYVQNPTGQVPSYLALSELQRRKEMRDKYRAQQPEKTTVAEDLEQQAQPSGLAMLAKNPTPQGAPSEQGVAGLPVPDQMFSEKSMAAGGIVSFAGEDGSYVQSYPNYEGEPSSLIGRGWDYLTGGLKNYADKKSQLLELQRQKEQLMPNIFERLTPSQLSIRKSQIADIETKQKAIRNPSSGYEYAPGEKATLTPEEVKQKTIEDAKNKPYVPLTDKEKADLINKFKPQNTTVKGAPATSTGSYEDELEKRMAIYKKYMGGDEDKQALKDKLTAMEKRALAREEQAPWLALAEAGFKTAAGTSPYALTNIGAGAQAGLQSYGAAQDKMAALEEKRYALMNEAAKADRAEKQAMITFGENSYQHKAAMDQRERLANAELAIKREQLGIEREKITASKDKGLTKSMYEQIVKSNQYYDKQIADLSSQASNPKIKQMIDNLKAQKAQNELHIRSIYQNFNTSGLSNTSFNADDWSVEELAS